MLYTPNSHLPPAHWQLAIAAMAPDERMAFALDALPVADGAVRSVAIAALSDVTEVVYVLGHLERRRRRAGTIVELAEAFVARSWSLDERARVTAAALDALARGWGDDVASYELVADWVARERWQSPLVADVCAAWRRRPRARDALLAMVRRDTPPPRVAAAVALLGAGWIADREVRAALRRAAGAAGDPETRARSLFAAVGATDGRGEPLLRACFGDGRPLVFRTPTPGRSRARLVRARAIEDPDPGVRCTAWLALVAAAGDPRERAEIVVEAAATEVDERVRAVVAAGVQVGVDGRRPRDLDGAAEVLLAAASDARAEVAAAAARALTALHGSHRVDVWHTLERLATEGCVDVRRAIAGGGGATSIRVLAASLREDRDALVRAGAAASIALAASDDRRVLNALTWSARSDPDARVRGAALAGLAGWRSDLAVEPARRWRDVATHAVVALMGLSRQRLFATPLDAPYRLWLDDCTWRRRLRRLAPEPDEVALDVHVVRVLQARAALEPDADVRALASAILARARAAERSAAGPRDALAL